MKLELAPMEGITTYVYRNALNKYYGGIDTYFSPFISTHKNKELNYKEINDILPEHNKDITLIPQVLTKDIDEFIFTAKQITDLGYDIINLNFGCPSATVTAKDKGAGILAYPERVEKLLDDIFSKTDIRISVKTRIGYAEKEEWPRLLKIYEKFPLEELIIHARIREDFYNRPADMSILDTIPEDLFHKTRISYNGDIYSGEDINKLQEYNKPLHAVMLGRGIISKPYIASHIKCSEKKLDSSTFKAFNIELMNEYNKEMKSDRNTLFKLKELWVYMAKAWELSERQIKQIKKCSSLKEYELILNSLL